MNKKKEQIRKWITDWIAQGTGMYSSDSLVPRPRPALCTVSGGKLGGSWNKATQVTVHPSTSLRVAVSLSSTTFCIAMAT